MPEAGYIAGDPESPVAICTLSSNDLLQDLARSSVADRVSIIGPLETENIGIERMAVSLLERPAIRFLILCGDERRGPYQAQALQSLFANGLGDNGSIPGARGHRARLPTLTAEHVEALRRQVTLCDLVGVHEVDRIISAVDECRASNLGRFVESVELPTQEPIVVEPRPFRLKEHDPQGFFVVLVDREAGRLLVEHYHINGILAHRIVGPDAESLCGALLEWGLVSLMDHASYLGRELAKAEIALREGVNYRQDEPLGHA